MFKAPAVAFACLMLAASPAMAQRGAPITQGVTSSDLSTQVATVRQQNAELKVQVNNLLGDIMTLTGRVETMEFKLSRRKAATIRPRRPLPRARVASPPARHS